MSRSASAVFISSYSCAHLKHRVMRWFRSAFTHSFARFVREVDEEKKKEKREPARRAQNSIKISSVTQPLTVRNSYGTQFGICVLCCLLCSMPDDFCHSRCACVCVCAAATTVTVFQVPSKASRGVLFLLFFIRSFAQQTQSNRESAYSLNYSNC